LELVSPYNFRPICLPYPKMRGSSHFNEILVNIFDISNVFLN